MLWSDIGKKSKAFKCNHPLFNSECYWILEWSFHLKHWCLNVMGVYPKTKSNTFTCISIYFVLNTIEFLNYHLLPTVHYSNETVISLRQTNDIFTRIRAYFIWNVVFINEGLFQTVDCSNALIHKHEIWILVIITFKYCITKSFMMNHCATRNARKTTQWYNGFDIVGFMNSINQLNTLSVRFFFPCKPFGRNFPKLCLPFFLNFFSQIVII